jgi:hypothetical protein
MTDETFERIRAFCERNYVSDPSGALGNLARIPVIVSAEISDDEPEFREHPYPTLIRLSRGDFGDLRQRCLRAEEQERLHTDLGIGHLLAEAS